MRRAVFALVLTGCGGFLPFFGDDDDDPPPAPTASDAASESAEGSSDGGTGEIDAGSDAGSDAQALVWHCTTTLPSVPTSEQQCNMERLQSCNRPDDPPIDQPCAMRGESIAYCPQVCQKSAPGSSAYSYTLTSCNCQP